MEQALKDLVRSYRDSEHHSFTNGDIGASRAWGRAADELEELIKERF
jgi:hypothetical protein